MTHLQNATTCFIFKLRQFKDELEMWANAQPDGRPAEYR